MLLVNDTAPMPLIQANEPDAAKRTITFSLVGTDGISPANSEDGGQPQWRYVGTGEDDWTGTGIGTLTFTGNGTYEAVLSTSIIDTPGDRILTRYKSLNTAECPGDSVEVVAYDPTTNSTTDAGTGDIEVTHDFGGTDALRVVHSGEGLDDVVIRAYITSDYEAGDFTVKAQAHTGSDGRFIAPMMLDADTYTLTFQKDGYELADTEIVVE